MSTSLVQRTFPSLLSKSNIFIHYSFFHYDCFVTDTCFYIIYKGQVHLINRLLSNDADIIALCRSTSALIEVKSVDGYQGRERDIIIFSTVRSNRSGAIGFVSDWKRMNVALTRAKSALLVVGDIETLAESGDIYWQAFMKWCTGSRCIIDDTERRSSAQ